MIAIEKLEGITGELYQMSLVFLGLCKGSRRHCIKQHPQYMCDRDAHVLSSRLAPGL